MTLLFFVQLVVEWTLVRGVARQMEAFKEGFNSVFPLSNMQGLFYPSEVLIKSMIHIIIIIMNFFTSRWIS